MWQGKEQHYCVKRWLKGLRLLSSLLVNSQLIIGWLAIQPVGEDNGSPSLFMQSHPCGEQRQCKSAACMQANSTIMGGIPKQSLTMAFRLSPVGKNGYKVTPAA